MITTVCIFIYSLLSSTNVLRYRNDSHIFAPIYTLMLKSVILCFIGIFIKTPSSPLAIHKVIEPIYHRLLLSTCFHSQYMSTFHFHGFCQFRYKQFLNHTINRPSSDSEYFFICLITSIIYLIIVCSFRLMLYFSALLTYPIAITILVHHRHSAMTRCFW